MKSVGVGEAKKIATFIALGGIATTSWFEQEDFKTLKALEELLKSLGLSN